MTIAITPLYAGILALLFMALSMRVIRLRRQHQIAIGDNDNLLLRRAIGVQANFAEYSPLALLLLAFLEMQAFSSTIVHAMGLALVAGRFIHAYGVSQEDENYNYRVLGMSLTFLVIGLSALLLIGSYLAD